MVREYAKVDAVIEASDVWAHIRVYAPAGNGSVVVVGELSDRPWPPPRVALPPLVAAVRESYREVLGAQIRWYVYRPWRGRAADGLAEFQVRAVGVLPAVDVPFAAVEDLIGAPLPRYCDLDYTRAGVRASRRAVQAFSELYQQLTASDDWLWDGEQPREVLDDLGRVLSQARDVAGVLAATAALSDADPRLRFALAGPVQDALREALAVAARGSEWLPRRGQGGGEEPTLWGEFVLDLDLERGAPALGLAHVRLYFPVGGVALLVFSQLEEATGVPVLATAVDLARRVLRRLSVPESLATRVLVYYPEGMLTGGSGFVVPGDEAAPARVAYEQVVAWAGGPVRRFPAAAACVARLP